MGEPARKRMTYAEYAELERAAETKHEFYDGEIYAMSGGTRAHSKMGAQVTALLWLALRGKPCEVHGTEMRLFVEATGNSFYPDAMVVCGEFQAAFGDDHAVVNPSLLVEVISASSDSYDRGMKFVNYQEVPTLKDYLVVSQFERRVWHYQRVHEDEWRIRDLTGGEIELGIGISLGIDAIYDGIELTPRA